MLLSHLKTATLITAAAALVASSAACDETTTPDPNVVQVQQFPECDRDFPTTDPDPNRAWTANAVTLVSEQLSPGVFAVYDTNAATSAPLGYPLATSGGFVIGDDGVLVIETMINRRLFCQVIDLVREQTDLPVLYAVNTSHHGDHSYGNAFLPNDVKVVQHQGTVNFITDPTSFAGDIAFMEANFGTDQGIDEITAVAADIVVDDTGWSVNLGNRAVEARYFGFGQTDGDLFVHVPDANTVWTGNPIVARAPGIPWLLDGHAAEVRTTLAAVLAAFPGSTIVPGHDAPRPIAELDFSIDYLDALIAAVQAAVDAGKTLEETVAAVTLDEFQGYALWDWVHSSVNIGTTFADLSATQ